MTLKSPSTSLVDRKWYALLRNMNFSCVLYGSPTLRAKALHFEHCQTLQPDFDYESRRDCPTLRS